LGILAANSDKKNGFTSRILAVYFGRKRITSMQSWFSLLLMMGTQGT